MIKRTAATACLALLATLAQGSGAFHPDRANVWVFGAEAGAGRGFAVQDWTTSALYQSGDPSANIDLEGGSPVALTVAGMVNMILVNESGASWPAASATTPPFAVSGLSLGSPNTQDGDGVPTLSILPADGAYTETVEVVLQVEPAGDSTAPVYVEWELDDGTASESFNETLSSPSWQIRFYLVDSGTYNIQALASQDGDKSDRRQREITIDASVDPNRDTDGDGIPDRVEVALGGSPLDSDGERDNDGDGWTDLQEALRCADPDPQACQAGEPEDTDLDGWSDFDEIWRGTDPDDPTGVDGDGKRVPAAYPDRPAARRLTEIEYRLEPSPVHQDKAGTVLAPLALGTAAGVTGNGLYDNRALPTEEELADQPVSQTLDGLPPRLNRVTAGEALQAGDMPAMRLPAGEALVLRAEGEDTASGEPDGVVQKRLLPGRADLTPEQVNREIAGRWSTVAEWFQAYRQLLADKLVLKQTGLTLTPASSTDANLLAGQLSLLDDSLEWQPGLARADLPASAVRRWRNLLQARHEALAEGDPTKSKPAVAAMLEAVRSAGLSDLDALIADLESLHAAPYGDGVPLYRQLIERGQTGLSATERYLLALYLTLNTDQIRALAGLTNPDDDSDNDGISNGAELSGVVWTRPDRADTDGDGVDDGQDPCPRDKANTCLGDGIIADDRDDDGIDDALDNCPDTPNPLQQDDNGAVGGPDGIGNACGEEWPVVITSPRANLRVTAGTEVELRAQTTEAADGDEFVNWDFDDAGSSTELNPASIMFSQPGSRVITLTVEDGGGDYQLQRTVEVLGSAGELMPTVTLADQTVREPDSDPGDPEASIYVAFDVTLSTAAEKTVTVDWALSEETATASADYRDNSGTLRFDAGQDLATGLIEILPDNEKEEDEAFWIELLRVDNALLEITKAQVVITEGATRDMTRSVLKESVVSTADDRYTVPVDATSVLNILVNDETNGGIPVIASAPRNGDLKVLDDGTVHYQPVGGFSGVDEFEYAVDGVSARVELFVTAGYVLHNDDDGVWMRELGGRRDDIRLTGAALDGLRRHTRLSPDGRHFLVLDQDELRLYGPGSRRDRQHLETGLSGTAAAFSPSGRYLAWQADDGTVFHLDLHHYQAPVALSVIGEPLQDLTWVGGSLAGVACDRLYRPQYSATPVLDGGRSCSAAAPRALGEPRLFDLAGLPVWWLDGYLLTSDGSDVVTATPGNLVVDKRDGAMAVNDGRLLFIAEQGGVAGLFALSDAATVSRLSGAGQQVEAFAVGDNDRVAYVDIAGAQTDRFWAPGMTVPMMEAADLRTPAAVDNGWTLVEGHGSGERVTRVNAAGEPRVVAGDHAAGMVDYRYTGAGWLLLSGEMPHSLELEPGDGSVSILDDRVGITDTLTVFLP